VRRKNAHDVWEVTRDGGQVVVRCTCAWSCRANKEDDARRMFEEHATRERRALSKTCRRR